jgi:RNA polymerase sigma-70 factor (ECF subfamily)
MRRDSGWDWDALGRRCRLEAFSVLRDRNAADEAAQEAMARAWRKRHSCRTPSHPDPWVAQIARNEALRLRSRERTRSEREDPHREPESAPGWHADEDRLLDRLSVRAALARLSPQERQLVHLRYGNDLAQPAIAELLDLPEGTVKVRLHRIRQRLRTVISEAS